MSILGLAMQRELATHLKHCTPTFFRLHLADRTSFVPWVRYWAAEKYIVNDILFQQFGLLDMSKYHAPARDADLGVRSVKERIRFYSNQQELFGWLNSKVRWFSILRLPSQANAELRAAYKTLGKRNSRWDKRGRRPREYEACRGMLGLGDRHLRRNQLLKDPCGKYIGITAGLQNHPHKTNNELFNLLLRKIAGDQKCPQLLVEAAIIYSFLSVVFGFQEPKENARARPRSDRLQHREVLELHSTLAAGFRLNHPETYARTLNKYQSLYARTVRNRQEVSTPPLAHLVPKHAAAARILSEMKIRRFMLLFHRDISHRRSAAE